MGNTIADPAGAGAYLTTGAGAEAGSGAGSGSVLGGGGAACPSAPRTFVNEGTCVRRAAGACAGPPGLAHTPFGITPASLRRWHTGSGKYVYAVTGLVLEGSRAAIPFCVTGTRSRWVRATTAGGCPQAPPGSLAAAPSPLDAGTARVVRAVSGRAVELRCEWV